MHIEIAEVHTGPSGYRVLHLGIGESPEEAEWCGSIEVRPKEKLVLYAALKVAVRYAKGLDSLCLDGEVVKGQRSRLSLETLASKSPRLRRGAR